MTAPTNTYVKHASVWIVDGEEVNLNQVERRWREPDANTLLRELWDALHWEWAASDRTPQEVWRDTLNHIALIDIKKPWGL